MRGGIKQGRNTTPVCHHEHPKHVPTSASTPAPPEERESDGGNKKKEDKPERGVVSMQMRREPVRFHSNKNMSIE